MTLRIIQLAGEQLIVARFAARRGTLTFLGGRQEEWPAGVDLAMAIKDLAEAPATDERVVLAVPAAQVTMRQLQLPLTGRQQVRDILPLELKGELAQDTADLVFDALPTGTGPQLAFWLPQNALAPLLAAAAAAGCDAEIATYAPACWGALIPAADQQLTVALSDGSVCALFVGGGPRFFRTFTGSVAEELPRTLTALELGQGLIVDRCYLFGAAAALFRADSEALPTVCTLLPTDGFLAGVFGSDPQAARDLASLAAVALLTETGEPLNFRQGALAYTAGRERLRKSLRLPAMLAVCIVIALFAELGVRWQLLRRDLVSLDRSVGAIYKEVFPKRKPVDEAAEIKAEIRRLSGNSGESSPLAALKILADGLGEGISGCTEVEIDGQSIRLRGEGKSLQAVNELKGRLSQKLTGLDLVESRSKGTGEVVFVMRATGLKGEAQ